MAEYLSPGVYVEEYDSGATPMQGVSTSTAGFIGLAEALVSAVGLSVWKDGVVFAILIVVLCVKPTGLFGEKVTDKV